MSRLLLALSSTLVCVATIEMYLRLAQPGSVHALDNAAFTRPSQLPGQTWELIPHAGNPHFVGGPVSINEHGLRGPSFELNKTAGTYRILAVGDSVTFGYGVADDAGFARQLGSRLDVPGMQVEVLNAGLPGAGLSYYRESVQRWCSRVDADLVLVNLVLNDIAVYPGTPPQPAPTRAAAAPDLAPVLARSYAYTRGFRYAKSLLYNLGVLDLGNSEGYRFAALAEPTPATEVAWTSSLAVLAQVVDRTAACGAPLVFTVFPLEMQLDPEILSLYRDEMGLDLAADLAEMSPQRRLAAFADERGVPLVDLAPAFSEEPVAKLFLVGGYISRDPVHPSALGHARAAEYLARTLALWGTARP